MIKVLKKIRHQKIRRINLLGIVINFEEKTITIPKNYKIIFEGDANITSKKHINISSNYKKLDKNGQPYCINLNSD